MLGTMTLNDLMHDESFNPSRFDLRKLRWPHLLIAITLVTGIILLSAWPDFMHDRAPVDHDMPLIILGVVIAIGLLFGIPAGIYVLIRRLCRHRRRE